MVTCARRLPCCNNAYFPTKNEQIANILTHGVWILPTAASVLRLIFAARDKQLLPVTIYGISLLLLFVVSTVFHTVSLFAWHSKWRYALHISDRTMIFIFIAASYSPWIQLKELDEFSTYPFSSSLARSFFFYAIWICAFLGVLYQVIFYEMYKHKETIIYVTLGVLPALTLLFVIADMSGIFELSVGGIIYLIGVCFFKLDGRVPFAHAIWHMMVVLGSHIHYKAIDQYLVQKYLSA